MSTHSSRVMIIYSRHEYMIWCLHTLHGDTGMSLVFQEFMTAETFSSSALYIRSPTLFSVFLKTQSTSGHDFTLILCLLILCL